MKISFLVNYDLSATWALNELIPRLTQHEISVFYTRRPWRRNYPTTLESFMAFEAAALENLQQSPVASGCVDIERLQVLGCGQVAMLNSVNQADYNTLVAAEPDVIVSIRHMTILKEAVYALPEHRVLNLHSGILPTYQGVMSSFWAILNQETNLGTTLHYIEDASIDTGSVIAQTFTPFASEKSYLWNVLNLYQQGCDAIYDALETIASGQKLTATPQSGKANYHTFPDADALARFAKLGYRLFDQNDPIEFGLAN
ncbi:MAG: formyl transferase [Pseudomonadota bacterium]